MLLAIDVGNTNIVLGLFQGQELSYNWRISTDRRHTADEFGVILRNLFNLNNLDMDGITGVAISSVVPPLNAALKEMSEKYFSIIPLVVGPHTDTGLDIRLDNPRELGADRMVNAVAALNLYGPPLIVVDFGTATTFCAISREGRYLGGAIAPGIGIATEALFERAAKLPRVEFLKPEKVIGSDTVSSMQSGIYFGFVGQVDGIVARMIKELSGSPRVIATGGAAPLIAAASDTIDTVNQFLTLEGLRLLHAKNREKSV